MGKICQRCNSSKTRIIIDKEGRDLVVCDYCYFVKLSGNIDW